MKYEILQSEPQDKLITAPVTHVNVRVLGIAKHITVKTKGNGGIL